MRRILNHPSAVKAAGAAVTFLLSASVVFLSLVLGALDDIERRTWDWRQQTLARESRLDPAIKIIVIDQAAIEAFDREGNPWPLFRETYAAVVKFLERAGAKALAFDLLFTEASHFGVSDDRSFGNALSGTLPVVQAAVPSNRNSGSGEAFDRFREIQSRGLLGDARLVELLARFGLPRFANIIAPADEIARPARHLGSVSIPSDPDGTYRRLPLGAMVSGIPILTMPFALFHAGGGDLRDIVQDEFLVRFKTPNPPISILDVVASESRIESGEPPLIPLSEFRDSWVILGVSAPGASDIRPIPVDEKAPGYLFHANVLDNILHRSFAKKVPLWATLLLSTGSILLCAIVVLYGATIRQQALTLASVIAGFILVLHETSVFGYWLPAVVPLMGLTLAVVMAQGLRYQIEGKQRRFLQKAFQHYVSPAVIERIIEDPSRLSLGGERKQLSIFFSDIAGFTGISEKLPPGRLGALLNTFLTTMTDIILASGGTVDKYVGDAIVAFWNAPLTIPDHALKAVQAAIQCQNSLDGMQNALLEEYGTGIRMRIGINTGDVSVGNFGSQNRFNYTLIGDAANFASRLEGANKAFGTSILMSGETARLCKGAIGMRKVAEIKVVGKELAAPIFEPFIPRTRPELEAILPEYEEALRLYEEGRLEAALATFSRLEDPVSMAYALRIQDCLTTGASGQEWSPIWVLKEK